MYTYNVIIHIGAKVLEFMRQAYDMDSLADWTDEHFPHASKIVIYPL